MRFWCQYRPGVFHVDPTTLGPPDHRGRRDPVPGITVEFRTLGGLGAGSLLDTAEEQKKRGWSDEVRELVEEYLRNHSLWGFGLFYADDTLTTVRSSGAACNVMTLVQGGVRPCGRPVEAEGDLCDEHQRQRQQLETKEVQVEEGIDLPLPPQEANV